MLKSPMQDELFRARRFGKAVFGRAGDGAALHRIGEDALLEWRICSIALVEVDVVEMDGIDAERPDGRHDQRLQRARAADCRD